MKLTKLAIGLAAVLAFSAQANADQTFNLNSGNPLPVPSSWYLSNTVMSGLFTDSFNFSVTTPSLVNSVITSVSLITGINNLQIDLYQGSNLLEHGIQNSYAVPGYPALTVSSALDIPYTISPAIIYTLRVTGSGFAAGGSYGGNLNVSPVPEPTEGALLLSGMGLMGFIAARRSRKV